MKKALMNLFVGAILTAATYSIEWDYCIDGPGRGLPLAMVHPSHGDSYFFKLLDPSAQFGDEIDFDSILGNLLFWTVLSGIAFEFRERIVKRKDMKKS